MVRILTVIVVFAAIGICRESSAQILRGRQRSFVQAPQQQPPPAPPANPVPPSRSVPPGGPPGAPPNQPTPAAPGTPTGNPPGTPGKPWYECEDCAPTTECKGEGPCEKDNPPKIVKSDGPGCETTTCVPVDNKPDGELPSVPGTYTPFYKKCVDFTGKLDVPHYVLNKADTLMFAKKSYSSPCCTYQVCVVECCCTTTTKGCALHERDVQLQACIRQNDLIDVYVLNVPGMPKRWVRYMGISLNELRGHFRQFPGF